jgi:hypothetical protein
MTVIKYDVSDVESGGGGEDPQPGMYKGKIVSVTHRTKKSNGDPANDLEVVVDIGAQYKRLWTYIALDNQSAAWKLREFTDALGIAPKGSIDTAKITKQQPEVNVKVSADTDQEGNYRGRVKNLFKPGIATDEEDGEGDGEAADAGYSEWSVEDLAAEIETRGLDMPAGRKTVAKLAEVLETDDAEGGEPAEPEDNSAEVNLPEEYQDIDSWEDSDLKEVLEELDLKVSGRFSAQKARDLIIEHVSENGSAPEAEAEAEAEGDDYDEWELQDLLDEIETRVAQGAEIEISGRKTKDKAVTALREDDKLAF